MKEHHTKKDYVNEILRLNRVLIQMKCNSEDDKNIKRLIAENLRNLAVIEADEAKRREDAKAEKELSRLDRCLYDPEAI